MAYPAADWRIAGCWREAVKWIRAARQSVDCRGRRSHLSAKPVRRWANLLRQTGIPVGETQAGKGSLPFDHPQNLGAVGVTGTPGANIAAREADLVIGIGTRLSDFTTASKTAFQNPDVRFININVGGVRRLQAFGGLPLVGDARACLEELTAALARLSRGCGLCRRRSRNARAEWETEVDRDSTGCASGRRSARAK